MTNNSPEGQQDPKDLVTVREAAEAAGVTALSLYAAIRAGTLVGYRMTGRVQVSLSAVHARIRPRDPAAPADAVPARAAERAAGIRRNVVYVWIKQDLLPSWQGRYGQLVRLEDVRRIAKERGLIVSGAEQEQGKEAGP